MVPFHEVEPRLREFFEGRADHDLVAAYLYGSVARGEARPGSDVDLAVLGRGPGPKTYTDLRPRLALEGELEALLGRPVQLLSLEGAPADLVHEVLRDGRLVLERDRAARVAFEVRRRNEYFDLLPILREYRRLAPS